MKTASLKTYTKKLKTKKTTKTTTSKKSSSTVTKKTETTVKTSERYKKKSKIKTVITTTKTTVTTTTVAASSVSSQSYYTESSSQTSGSGTNTEISISQAAPRVDSRVPSAFNALGFKIYINSGVSYSGLCDTKNQSIILKRADETVYHELGHLWPLWPETRTGVRRSSRSIIRKKESIRRIIKHMLPRTVLSISRNHSKNIH